MWRLHLLLLLQQHYGAVAVYGNSSAAIPCTSTPHHPRALAMLAVRHCSILKTQEVGLPAEP
jgi:hypothetical protein